jgi:glycerol-3-phosphate acyltransferase PlsX
MRVAIDALGGDRAPDQVVKGALASARADEATELVLVGPESVVRKAIETHGGVPPNVSLLDAPEVVAMDEGAASSLRTKPRSSIAVGIDLLAGHEADAFVSAGNTGAVAAAAFLKLKRLKGVKRPGIAVPLKAVFNVCLGMEMGANIQCKPEHLYQYGVMASVFAHHLLGVERPRVGLINIGEEENKGTRLVQEAYRLLKRSHLNFIGNIEGKDIFAGACDVFVCDGFVGNVILKTAEGLMMAALQKFRDQAERDEKAREGFKLLRPVFDFFMNMSDYSEYGGAPLLGTEGAVIICHGRSDAKAIENAVREAKSFVQRGVNAAMSDALARGGEVS